MPTTFGKKAEGGKLEELKAAESCRGVGGAVLQTSVCRDERRWVCVADFSGGALAGGMLGTT